MRNPERIDKILDEIEKYWKANPDLRLGQLISNLHHASRGGRGDIFYFEDMDLLFALEQANTRIGFARLDDGAVVVSIDGEEEEFPSIEKAATYVNSQYPIYGLEYLTEFIKSMAIQPRRERSGV